MIERIISCYTRKLDDGEGEDDTYAKLAHCEASGSSDVLVGRLARLIRIAPRCTVVLSSSWRQPEHRFRVERLEAALAQHLGVPFWEFDARTSLAHERGAPDRLQRVGDYIADHVAASNQPQKLRVLVLDDFMVNAFHGWQVEGWPMDSAEAAESYLRCRAERRLGPDRSAGFAVKVIHTYDEWTTPSSLCVQVGTGLTLKHFRRAEAFLAGSSSGSCEKGVIGERATCCRAQQGPLAFEAECDRR